MSAVLECSLNQPFAEHPQPAAVAMKLSDLAEHEEQLEE